MEVALICVSLGFSILILIIVIVFSFKFKNKGRNDNAGQSSFELGKISNQIEDIEDKLGKSIKQTVSEEVIKIQNKQIEDAERANKKLDDFQSKMDEGLEKKFKTLSEAVEGKLADINNKVDQKISEGFKGTGETLTQVRERLTAIDEAQKNIEGLSKEVISLKTILEGNQSRGAYGEYQLSMVLNNVFGDLYGCYEEQFTIKRTRDGKDVRADAVVFMPPPNKMICIDSKFPFKDYERLFATDNEDERKALCKDFASSVKKHITTIKEKYIIDGKTARQAIMFIPNDGVFAFIHHNLFDEVVKFSREKEVILTSPSTLPAILTTMKMVRIESQRAENAKAISLQIHKLSKDFEMFGREWESFSSALSKVSGNKEKLDSRVNRLNTKFDSIKSSDLIEEKEQEKTLDVLSLDEDDQNSEKI